MTQQTISEYIQLNVEDEKGQCFVTYDHDRFFISASEAACACKRHDETKPFQEQLKKLFDHLAEWLKGHREKIEKAFVTVREGGLLFLVVRNSVPYDSEIENSLLDLDIEVAQASGFDLLAMDVLALPLTSEESYQAFLAPGCTWEYA